MPNSNQPRGGVAPGDLPAEVHSALTLTGQAETALSLAEGILRAEDRIPVLLSIAGSAVRTGDAAGNEKLTQERSMGRIDGDGRGVDQG